MSVCGILELYPELCAWAISGLPRDGLCPLLNLLLPLQQVPQQELGEIQDVPEAPQGLQLPAEGGTHLGSKATAGEENF